MSKNLVIVESPAKAKTINKFLGRDYHVEPSMGHVRDLPKSTLGVDVERGGGSELAKQPGERPLVQLRRPGVERLVVMRPVARAPQEWCRTTPAVATFLGACDHGKALVSDTFGQAPIAFEIPLLDGQGDMMPTGEQRRDRGLERVDVLLLLGDEEDAHRRLLPLPPLQLFTQHFEVRSRRRTQQPQDP